jgi:hypothetical protein
MLNGEPVSDAAAKTFDVALILHADHEMNASTFTARVIASTLSDMHSAITGAIGALKGPLHGGANEQVMKLLQSIPEGASVEDEIHGRLERKERIMGFGHRVYKTWDPRAVILKRFSKQLADESGDPRWYDMSESIEHTVVSEKGLYPNVDFYSASTYHYLGIDTGLFTPIFAMSHRVAPSRDEADLQVGVHRSGVALVDVEHDLAQAEPLEGVLADERRRLGALARAAVGGLADQDREPGPAPRPQLQPSVPDHRATAGLLDPEGDQVRVGQRLAAPRAQLGQGRDAVRRPPPAVQVAGRHRV